MAVMQNSLIFGGVNSADYGIYISGEGVFNAPKRDVEMISIPGRNGEFALDKGRFENIEVTYPAFNFEPDDYETFAKNLSDFRNAICSLRGYQRLTDTFHPEEYRMATYIGGLDIKPIKYNTASQFNLVFDCKPQRWLTSGETAVTVANNGTLTNPTLFESSPLLETEGYGTIGFNGYEIKIEDAQTIGDVVLVNAGSTTTHFPAGNYENFNGNEVFLNIGDTITVPSIAVTVVETVKPVVTIQSVARESSQDLLEATIRASSSRTIEVVIKSQPTEFQYGTAGTSVVGRASFSWTLYNTVSAASWTWTGQECTVSAEYDGDKLITFLSSGLHLPVNGWWDDSAKKIEYPPVVGTSTQDISLGHAYIDCDLGEAYKIEGDGAISLNRYIDLGSDLPKLVIGANEITYDDTITELKVTPRWWKV